MSFTTTEVLEEVRELVQDTNATYQRYSDAFLLRKLNQAMRRFALLRPDLFTAVSTITCVAGTAQTAPTDSIRLTDVLSNTLGETVKEIQAEAMDLMFPAWGNDAPGPATNWIRYVRDPNRFYVYPKASTAETLQVLYAKSPATLAAGNTVVVQDAYFPAVVDCTAWLVESIDTESVASGRAKAHKDSFIEMVSGSLQARALTDVDAAGLDKKEVM